MLVVICIALPPETIFFEDQGNSDPFAFTVEAERSQTSQRQRRRPRGYDEPWRALNLEFEPTSEHALALVIETTFGLGSLEGRLKGPYAVKDQANKSSGTAYTTWLRSVGAYELPKDQGMGFEMLEFEGLDGPPAVPIRYNPLEVVNIAPRSFQL